MNNLEKEKEKINNKPRNYTKIESKNINGTVDRSDNFPGYFEKTDLLFLLNVSNKRFLATCWYCFHFFL